MLTSCFPSPIRTKGMSLSCGVGKVLKRNTNSFKAKDYAFSQHLHNGYKPQRARIHRTDLPPFQGHLKLWDSTSPCPIFAGNNVGCAKEHTTLVFEEHTIVSETINFLQVLMVLVIFTTVQGSQTMFRLKANSRKLWEAACLQAWHESWVQERTQKVHLNYCWSWVKKRQTWVTCEW